MAQLAYRNCNYFVILYIAHTCRILIILTRSTILPTYIAIRLYTQILGKHSGVPFISDLGVTISADMKVSEQCGIAASKGNQILGLIRRNITYKEKKLIIPLYKAIVRPHLEYCIQASRPYRKKDIDTLERIQRRATKMIPELRDLSYEERLKECGLTTIETRRLRGDQIEVFKILNGYENIDRNMFFSLKKDSRTRGHEVKLVKDQCRLDIRKHSFSQRTINEWNKLSTDCVTASSVNMFKNKVDTYLRRAGYK